MIEHFAKTSDGQLVLYAIKSVGINNSVAFDYKETPSSWPKNPPESLGRPLILDIWEIPER